MTDPDKESWLAEPENPEPADFPDAPVSPKVQAAVEAFERAVRQIPPGMRKTMADVSEALAKRRAAIWSIARGPHWHVFEDRGITPEIMVHRPYAEWTPEHPEPVKEAWHQYLDEGQRRWLSGIASQSGGFVIHRHPPPGLGLADVPAEIRPHNKVYTGRGDHDHEKVRAYRRDPERLAEHLRKKHNPEAIKSIKLAEDATVHEDGNVTGWHAHLTKYVFPPSPWMWTPCKRDHDAMPEKKLAKHLQKCRGGMEKVKDKSQERAKRIDVHPLAVPRLDSPDTSRVSFGLEGCLKADALLVKGEAVFSVPSVTLWHAPELDAFAERYLRGKLVLIVPDADWRENDLVITQAMMARQHLRRRHGIDAYVAAPPVPENPERDAGGKLKHNGVDDFLADGWTVEDLVVVNREVPADKIREWVRWQDAGMEVLRDSEVLQCLALHAGHGGRWLDGSLKERPGELHRSFSAYTSLLGWSDYRRVKRAIEALADLPGLESDRAITIEKGGLELAEPELKLGGGEWYWSELDWEDRPRITVAPEFRAIESEPVRLADFKPGAEQFAMVDTTEARRDRQRRLNRERQARHRAAA
jgi:hypothetical protein